jgi:Xaa-Pro aminopeptidase
MSSRLSQLQKLIQESELDGYLVPTTDEHLNEYVPLHHRRLEALSGFNGSAGIAIVLQEGRSQLFVDSRYHIQADAQSGDQFEIRKLGLAGVPDVVGWLAGQSTGCRFGVDPFTVSPRSWRRWSQALMNCQSELVPVPGNLVDQTGSIAMPERVEPNLLPLSWTGRSTSEKLTELRDQLDKHQATHLLLTQLDEIAWLTNLRGKDVPCNPVFESYALISKAEAICFCHFPTSTELKSLTDWTFHPYEDYAPTLKQLAADDSACVWLDPQGVTMGTLLLLQDQSAQVLEAESPVIMPRALKNEVELQRIRYAHRQAAVGKIQSLARLKQAERNSEKVSEQQYAGWLRSYYEKRPDFADLSFETIAGAGANAAIVHYSNPSAEKILTDGEFLLVDSGIQCGGGTTDATRTMIWGEPDAEQQRCYTRVLQAHIRLARQVFPEGTNGAVLDGVTRSLLWNEGLDFGHGTGHGVGAFLGVHEGPQRISAFAGDVGFRSGMIISNEPGYYRTGWGGIRLENLYVVQSATQHPRHPDGKKWLCFDTLTLIPFERKLVCEELLTEDEWNWLQHYHKRVWEEISPLLNEDGEKEYLQQACDWSQRLQAAA